MTGRRLTYTDGHPDLEWLGALRDAELTADEVTEVEAHAADCPVCRQHLADLSVLAGLTSDLEPALPDASYWPGLTGRILDRVAAERDRTAPGVEGGVAARMAGVGESRAARDPLPIIKKARPNPTPFWRMLVPLAAVCGVALLSWRLLLSGSSMMGEVGSPAPMHPTRSLKVESSAAPATDAAPREAGGAADREADAVGRLNARDVTAEKKAATAPIPGEPVLQAAGRPAEELRSAPPPIAPAGGAGSATARSPAADSREALSLDQPAAAVSNPSAPAPATVGAAAPAATAGPPEAFSKSADAGQAAEAYSVPVLSEANASSPMPYRAQLAAGVPLDSVLARSGREADTLWARLRAENSSARDDEPRGADAARARQADRAAAPSAIAAPVDSLQILRAIAIEEERLSLLKELRPTVDRREIVARLEWLRNIWKKQGH